MGGLEADKLFDDKAFGKSTTARPQLEALLLGLFSKATRWSFTLWIVWRGTLDDLRQLVRSLTGKGVQVEFIK